MSSEKPAVMLPWPAEDLSVYGPVEARQMGRVQHHVGRVMHRNWVSIPHVTHLLPLSLSYDHRVINGADAARFLCAIAEWLEGCDFS